MNPIDWREVTTEENIQMITGDIALVVFDKLSDLHRRVHEAVQGVEIDIDEYLAEVDPMIVQAMLVAVLGIVDRGALLTMHEIVRERVASGEYDEVIAELQDEREAGVER